MDITGVDPFGNITYSVNVKNTNSTRHKSTHSEREELPPFKESDLHNILVESFEVLTGDKWNNPPNAEEDNKNDLGYKENKGKAKLSLLFKQFPKALEAVTRCSEYGHNKYKKVDEDYLNFTRVKGGSKTYADAGLRHRLEQGVDNESKLPHQYHVAWNALAELELWIKENQK